MAKPKTLITMEGRVCTHCGKFKTWDNFYRKSDSPFGHRDQCSHCYYYSKKVMSRKLTDSEKEIIKDLIWQNINYAVIARQFHVHPNSIMRIARKCNHSISINFY